jgi:hypothetical protein
MAGSDVDRGRSRRLGAEDRGWSSMGRVLGCQMIKRSSDTVCGLHLAQGDKECGFLGLASKPVATVPVVWPQNYSLGFPSLGLKIDSCGLMIWPTKSP